MRLRDSSNYKYFHRKVSFYLVVVLAVVFTVTGAFECFRLTSIESKGLHAEGKVVRLNREYHSSRYGGHYNYHAIVDYMTENNLRIEFRDEMGSDPPAYHIGDAVPVLYLADHPKANSIVDRGSKNWQSPITLLGSGILMAWFVAQLRQKDKAIADKY